MATTIKITDTVNWAKAFVVQRPMQGVAGITDEPAVTTANLIMQTIMAPPFKWSWNRVENSSLVCTPGVTDYIITLANWGYLEKATSVDTNGNRFEIEINQVLSKESKQNRPMQIAPLLDDNAGNITFRIMPAPDQAYTISLTFQKAAPFAVAPLGTTTWAPIPDRYAFLYERGMLAHMYAMYNQQMYALNIEIFFRQLVAAAEGLTETEKAIFLEDQLRIVRTGQNSALGVSQGKQSRL
jgi:hypothetical protein